MEKMMTDRNRGARGVPAWVPIDVRNYVFHTELGQPIRVLARSQSCHASTIMRQIRKVEQRRDDPLVDRAIKALGQDAEAAATPVVELMQALRRLAMPDALLAIAMGMEQGVILQDMRSGAVDQGTKLASDLAMMLALRGWIACGQTTTRVLRYRITPAGRVALRELTAKAENRARSLAEGEGNFDKSSSGKDSFEEPNVMARAPSHDSPVQGLARRKDRDGKPFLDRVLVRAAERLREDFEVSQVRDTTGDTRPPNWEAVLAAIETHTPITQTGNEASGHVIRALTFLGPGLCEIALRCCCFLEGLETTEQHMGWAARSGKVVLRIALQRLALHYQETGDLGLKIG